MKIKSISFGILFFLGLILTYSTSLAQLFDQNPVNQGPIDPIEKTKVESLNNLFKDRRFDAGFLCYLNFFVDLNIVILENERTRIYKPLVSKKILFYTLDNLAELNETVLQDYFDRGLARIDSSKFEQAMTDFDKSLVYDPENADAYLNRGVLFIYSKQYPEALEELKKAEKFDKKNAGIFFNRGLIYYNQGDYQLALNQLNICIGLDEQYSRAYFEKGLVEDALGQKEEALKSLRKARNLGDPDATESIRKIKERVDKPSQKKS